MADMGLNESAEWGLLLTSATEKMGVTKQASGDHSGGASNCVTDADSKVDGRRYSMVAVPP